MCHLEFLFSFDRNISPLDADSDTQILTLSDSQRLKSSNFPTKPYYHLTFRAGTVARGIQLIYFYALKPLVSELGLSFFRARWTYIHESRIDFFKL